MKIPFSPPDITELEIEEVVKTLKSGWITTGPRTKELEKRLAEFCHTSRVVCLNSATAAEELNFRICGIGEGDEVIVPAYTYGKHFRIHKFRTMVSNADKIGSVVTVGNDSRITRVGSKLRGLRLDELPQIFDVLSGDSGIIGTTKKNLDFTGVSLA